MLCACGCGGETPIAPSTSPRMGRVKGQPYRFIHGHNGRLQNPGHSVDAKGCWIWRGYVNPDGYAGFMSLGEGKRTAKAATVYFLKGGLGPIPKGMQLDHLCRNRICVNPEHLEIVTPAENRRRSYDVKLSMAKAREIRALLTAGHRGVDIARRFEITKQTVNSVRANLNWKEAAG